MPRGKPEILGGWRPLERFYGETAHAVAIAQAPLEALHERVNQRRSRRTMLFIRKGQVKDRTHFRIVCLTLRTTPLPESNKCEP